MEFFSYISNHITIASQAPRFVLKEEHVLTITSSALSHIPTIAKAVVDALQEPVHASTNLASVCKDWPTPSIALPRWETDQPWTLLDSCTTTA